jgi:hypothetical protein
MLAVSPRANNAGLRFVVAEIFTLPPPEVIDTYLYGYLPFPAPEVADRVFIEKARVAHRDKVIEVGVRNIPVFLALLLPGVDKVLAGCEFATVVAYSRGYRPTDIQLTRAFHQAVRYPALQHRVIVCKRLRRQEKRVAVRDAVTGVDLAVARSQQQKRQ